MHDGMHFFLVFPQGTAARMFATHKTRIAKPLEKW